MRYCGLGHCSASSPRSLVSLVPTSASFSLPGVRSTGAGFCFNVGRGIVAMSPFLLAGISGAIGFSGGLIVCACFFALAAGVALVLPKSGAHADQIEGAPTQASPAVTRSQRA